MIYIYIYLIQFYNEYPQEFLKYFDVKNNSKIDIQISNKFTEFLEDHY